MFCRNCGHQISETDAFCAHCGTPQPISTQAKQPAPAQTAEPTPMQTPQPAPMQVQPTPMQTPQPAPMQVQQPAPMQAQQPAPAHAEETNVLAIVGFVLSFFVAIAGLVCSILGLKRAKELGGKGHGLALAGLIISIVSLALTVLIVIVYISLIGAALGTALYFY